MVHSCRFVPRDQAKAVLAVLANYKRLRELTAKWVAYPSVWLKKSANRSLDIPRERSSLHYYRMGVVETSTHLYRDVFCVIVQYGFQHKAVKKEPVFLCDHGIWFAEFDSNKHLCPPTFQIFSYYWRHYASGVTGVRNIICSRMNDFHALLSTWNSQGHSIWQYAAG